MKRLCRDSPAERLGYQKDGIMDIKKHKWFQGFDWDGLLERSLAPPLVPTVQSATDASNFLFVFSCEDRAQLGQGPIRSSPKYDLSPCLNFD